MFLSTALTDGQDYLGVTEDIVFSERQDRVCVDIPIVNDTIPEDPTESFCLNLTSLDPDGVFATMYACVAIVDDDGESLTGSMARRPALC